MNQEFEITNKALEKVKKLIKERDIDSETKIFYYKCPFCDFKAIISIHREGQWSWGNLRVMILNHLEKHITLIQDEDIKKYLEQNIVKKWQRK